MRDVYLYEDCTVLKNKLGIKEQKKLEEAEADFVVYRLKELTMNPLKGNYWAGMQRKMNIFKEEPVLGGLSIDYANYDSKICSKVLSKEIFVNYKRSQLAKMKKYVKILKH